MLRKVMFVCAAMTAFAWGVPAEAACVSLNGKSTNGVRDRHEIKPGQTDKDRYVRLTKGPATIQVDVRGTIGNCSARNERLSISVHWTKKSQAESCLRPSVRGPGSFLSCYFKADKVSRGQKSGKWFVFVKNPGRCTVYYDLICRNGRHTP